MAPESGIAILVLTASKDVATMALLLGRESLQEMGHNIGFEEAVVLIRSHADIIEKACVATYGDRTEKEQ